MDWRLGPPVLVGERVLWSGNNSNEPQIGTVRWLGVLPELNSSWCVGLELDKTLLEGGTDGKWMNRKLFDCQAKHGIIVPITEIQKLYSKTTSKYMASTESHSDLKLDDSQFGDFTRSNLNTESIKKSQDTLPLHRYSAFELKLSGWSFKNRISNRKSTSCLETKSKDLDSQEKKLEKVLDSLKSRRHSFKKKNQDGKLSSKKKRKKRKTSQDRECLKHSKTNYDSRSIKEELENLPDFIDSFSNAPTLDSKAFLKELNKKMNDVAGYFKEIKEDDAAAFKPELENQMDKIAPYNQQNPNVLAYGKEKKLFSFLKWFKKNKEDSLKPAKESSADSSPMFVRKLNSSCDSVDTLFSTQTVKSFAYIPPNQYEPSAPPSSLLDFENSLDENAFENYSFRRDVTEETESIYSKKKKRRAPAPPRLSRENSLPTTLEHKKSGEELIEENKTFHRRTVSESFKDKKAGAYCHVQGKRKAPLPPPKGSIYPNLQTFNNNQYPSLYKKKKPAPPPPSQEVKIDKTLTPSNFADDQHSGLKESFKNNTKSQETKSKVMDKNELTIENEENKLKINQTPKEKLTKDVSLSPLPSRPWYKRSHRDSNGSNIIKKDLLKGFEKKKSKETEDWMPEVGFSRRSLSTDSTHNKFNIFARLDKNDDKKKEEKRKSQISILTNISELDREAAEIVRKEQAEEKKMIAANDAKYYSKNNEPGVEKTPKEGNSKPLQQVSRGINLAKKAQSESEQKKEFDLKAKPNPIFSQFGANNKFEMLDQPKLIDPKAKNKENFKSAEATDIVKQSPLSLNDISSSSISANSLKSTQTSNNLNYFKVENKEVKYLNEPWVCSKCTLENPGWRVFCEICSSVKPRFLFNPTQNNLPDKLLMYQADKQKPEAEFKSTKTKGVSLPKENNQKQDPALTKELEKAKPNALPPKENGLKPEFTTTRESEKSKASPPREDKPKFESAATRESEKSKASPPREDKPKFESAATRESEKSKASPPREDKPKFESASNKNLDKLKPKESPPKENKVKVEPLSENQLEKPEPLSLENVFEDKEPLENLEGLRKKRTNFFCRKLGSSSEVDETKPETDETNLKDVLKEIKNYSPKSEEKNPKKTSPVNSNNSDSKHKKGLQTSQETSNDNTKYEEIKKKEPSFAKKKEIAEAYIVTKTIVLEDVIIKKADQGPEISTSVQTRSNLQLEPKMTDIRPPPRTKKGIVEVPSKTKPSTSKQLHKPLDLSPNDALEQSEKFNQDVEELTNKLTHPKGLADFKANIETMAPNTEMNTVAVNRLLRRLEASIYCGDHFVAAGLAKELALMKINCSVTRQMVEPASPSSQKITIDLYVEDKVSHQGPIPIQVSPDMTLLQLKKKAQQELGIPVNVQRWILGKKLATDDSETLEHNDVKTDSCSIFLYLVGPDKKNAEAAVSERQVEKNEDENSQDAKLSRKHPPPPSIKSKGWYYNYEEDHYSYCEDSDDDSSELSQVPEKPQRNKSQTKSSTLLNTNQNIKSQAPDENPKIEKPSIELQIRETENTLERELKLISVNSVKQKVERLNRSVEENSNIVRANSRSSKFSETWKCVACTFVNSSEKFNCSACNAKKVASRLALAKVETKETQIKNEPWKSINCKPRTSNGNIHYKELIELQDADLVPNAEPFNCPICMLDYSQGEGIILKDCLHTFCKACLIDTVKYSEDAEVKCPYLDEKYSCTSVLQQREIKALVPQGVFELHLAKSIKEAENKIGNAFHCKTPDCKGWCIYEDNVNEFHCPVCKFTNCLTCQAIHTGINCRQYQERMKDASETDVNAKKTRDMLEEMVEKGEAMACPKCQVVLMKKWGCDWLRCSMCKTEICWVTRGFRWGLGGKGDTTGGCKCGVNGVKCHPKCNYCH